MKVANGKIVQITEGELYKIYIEREWDNLFSFPDFVGCGPWEGLTGGSRGGLPGDRFTKRN